MAGTAWTSPGSRQSAAGGASNSKDSPHEPHKHPLPTVLPSQTAACNADAGVLGCWESGCMHECTAQMLGTFSRFSIVCMASHTFGGMSLPSNPNPNPNPNTLTLALTRTLTRTLTLTRTPTVTLTLT